MTIEIQPDHGARHCEHVCAEHTYSNREVGQLLAAIRTSVHYLTKNPITEQSLAFIVP